VLYSAGARNLWETSGYLSDSCFLQSKCV